MTPVVFRNPEHENGGCIFGDPTHILVRIEREQESVSGATRRRPRRTWLDEAIDEDDLELMEIVTMLLMADVL